ncbi:glycosyltransferase [Deinococcus maricopensis]|uniref:Glycosyl transferase family 2 n=1 Tax=Deinococcus maricopensis (strain DSM 21211 / LMG 22137 / NRRL B-23946 / LB-34) TaxID=709986 RepID=E8U5B3_DEIML|nr:glycosyltransferase [Deinococcus maricopensis]ADV66252.1 glycosyl transferase family 2 [Deinococcus maricopensis DSM 21211]
MFSVVVPARNEAAHLPALLRALAAQTLPPAEVIVVDNGSSDATARVARAGGAVVVPCATPGVARARQAGLDAARAPWIATTDADSLPRPDWLERLSAHTSGAVALYGPMRFSDATPVDAALSEAGYRVFLRAAHALGHANLAGANMAFSRMAAHLAGGYPDVEAREDILLGAALAQLGPVRYVPDALVLTSARRMHAAGGWAPFLWRHVRNLGGRTAGYFDGR